MPKSFNLFTRMLESLGDTIISSRQGLYDRHALHKLNVAGVSRLVDEYNNLMSKLSPSEVGLFRSKILSLDQKIWKGIYKYCWGEQQVINAWVKACSETIFTLTR